MAADVIELICELVCGSGSGARTASENWILIEPATVHQEFRVLLRCLNIAVTQEAVASEPLLGPR